MPNYFNRFVSYSMQTVCQLESIFKANGKYSSQDCLSCFKEISCPVDSTGSKNLFTMKGVLKPPPHTSYCGGYSKININFPSILVSGLLSIFLTYSNSNHPCIWMGAKAQNGDAAPPPNRINNITKSIQLNQQKVPWLMDYYVTIVQNEGFTRD